MLYIYGTVFNNARFVKDSIKSMDKLNIEKKFLIVDNYSSDGTYEILTELKSKYNIELKRVKCSRGKGRQIAMEMAYNDSTQNDLFMYFDLDTVYTDTFAAMINHLIRFIDQKTVCVYGMLSFKSANFDVPWRDLNYGEDWERAAHFIYKDYNYVKLKDDSGFSINESYIGHRERRYAKGYFLYKRWLRTTIDAIKGWNINSYKNLKEFGKIWKMKKTNYAILLIFIIFLKNRTYSYSQYLNNIYVEKNTLCLSNIEIFQNAISH